MKFKPEMSPKPKFTNEEVERMLSACLKGVKGNGLEFILSLQRQYDDKGWISPKQAEALSKFFSRLADSPTDRIDDPYVETLLDECHDHEPGNVFIGSLSDHWDRKGFLTKNQYEALLRFHNDLE